ncbi:MAG TPA: molybdopterin-dependent oxidoreductase [Candidatus Xenobia bacterium]|jgi:DMSO/TMAO reductase YedYZ molybdopterin-dependent catalytic subunit
MNRRAFVHYAASSSLLWMAGAGWGDPANPLARSTPFGRARLVRLLPFDDPRKIPPNTLEGRGGDTVLCTDLTRVTPRYPIPATDHFYVIRDLPEGDSWSESGIRVYGLVQRPHTVKVDDLIRRRRPQGLHLLECSGNARHWGFRLLSPARWEGVPIADVLARAGRKPAATQVRVAGLEGCKAGPVASWTFKIEDLVGAGAFLATHMNGQRLPRQHGYPVRMVVPGWLGCCSIKWVNEIELVDDTAVPSAHMISYAPLTMQAGEPKFTRDFKPALMEVAAMPIRVEEWQTDHGLRYRIEGLVWGGDKPVRNLIIRVDHETWRPVDAYTPPHDTRTWTFWYHEFHPKAPGKYHIQLRVADEGVVCRRLNADHYGRDVIILAV